MASGVSFVQGQPGEDAATAGAEDVPETVRTAFWLLVILLNLSIGALAVGLMLLGFRGQWQTGGALVLVGTAGLVLAYVRYRTARRKLDRAN